MTEHYVRNKVTFLFQIVENNYLNMSTKLSSYMTSNNLAMAKVFLFFLWVFVNIISSTRQRNGFNI